MYEVFLGSDLMPITPSKINMKVKGNNKTMTLINDGEVNMLKVPGLTEFDFEVLLPQVKYPFARYADGDFKSASYFIDAFEKLITSQKPFYFKILRALPNGVPLFANEMLVSLEDYTVKDDVGQGFDITVSIKLKQYKEYNTNICKVVEGENGEQSLEVESKRDSSSSPEPTTAPKTYKVVKGDTLWGVAKKFYGNGSKYPNLVSANKIDNPNLIRVGQVLTIPVLEV